MLKEKVSRQKKKYHAETNCFAPKENLSQQNNKAIVIIKPFIQFFNKNSSSTLLQIILINLKVFKKQCDDKLGFFRAGNFFSHL